MKGGGERLGYRSRKHGMALYNHPENSREITPVDA